MVHTFDFSERNDRVTLKLEVGQVVYIPGVADIRSITESSGVKTTKAMAKEDKMINAGLIEKVGRNRETHYKVKE